MTLARRCLLSLSRLVDYQWPWRVVLQSTSILFSVIAIGLYASHLTTYFVGVFSVVVIFPLLVTLIFNVVVLFLQLKRRRRIHPTIFVSVDFVLTLTYAIFIFGCVGSVSNARNHQHIATAQYNDAAEKCGEYEQNNQAHPTYAEHCNELPLLMREMNRSGPICRIFEAELSFTIFLMFVHLGLFMTAGVDLYECRRDRRETSENELHSYTNQRQMTPG